MGNTTISESYHKKNFSVIEGLLTIYILQNNSPSFLLFLHLEEGP